MISMSAIAQEEFDRNKTTEFMLILDHSGSMNGRPLETVKKG